MKFGLVAAALGAAFAVSMPANASVTFGLTGSAAINGSHANSQIFTGSDGVTKVRATAWSISGSTVYDSYLGVFGGGLGATSGDDGVGNSNTHTTDNETRKDFILLQFNTNVMFDSGTFSTFSVLGNSKDSDATIKYGTTGGSWTTQPALDGQNVTALNALFSGGFTSLGTGAGGARSLASSGVGNLWLVGADFINHDRTIDGFKFKNLNVTRFVPPPVPEPATWTMVIAGFGIVGGALRARVRRGGLLQA